MGKLVRLTALIGVLVLASGAPAYARGGGGGGGHGGGGGGHFGGGGGLGGGDAAGGPHGGFFRQHGFAGHHFHGHHRFESRHLDPHWRGIIRIRAPFDSYLGSDLAYR